MRRSLALTAMALGLALGAGHALADDWKNFPTPTEAADDMRAAPNAGPSDAQAANETAAAAQAKEDYYSRRARETLARERSTTVKPHPLALAHPDQLVVVCEAGCARDNEPEIVSMMPKPKGPAEGESRMEPTSAASGGATNVIACSAGCYDSPEVYAAPLPVGPSALKPAVLEHASSPEASPKPAEPFKRKREPFSPIR